MFDAPVKCPAGEAIGETRKGSGVRCRVEESSILADQDPRSIIAYCCGDYGTCPTWQAEKARIAAQRRESLIHDPRPMAWDY